MRLNEELLEMCEEFFEELASGDQEVKFCVESLRKFIEEDVDGRTNRDRQTLALAVQYRLEEIWSLLSPSEKQSDLADYYEALMAKLVPISGFEAEDMTLDDFDDYDEYRDDPYYEGDEEDL